VPEITCLHHRLLGVVSEKYALTAAFSMYRIVFPSQFGSQGVALSTGSPTPAIVGVKSLARVGR